MRNNFVCRFESERENKTTLVLSKQGLYEIPARIGLLTNMTRLKLDGNHLTYIPFIITNLINLEYINLKSNDFTEFPEALCCMRKLSFLDISNNKIKELPEDFGKLKITLKAFNISNNRLQKVPNYFGEMNGLKILRLDFNPIEYPPQSIIYLPNDMIKDEWLNRLKDYLKQDENILIRFIKS